MKKDTFSVSETGASEKGVWGILITAQCLCCGWNIIFAQIMFHLFKSQYHTLTYPKTDGANFFAEGNGKPQHAQDELNEVL